MSENSASRGLKRSLIIYSTLGVIVVGIVVSLVSIGPLYKRLKNEQKRHLLHQLEVKRMIVEEYLSRARDTALQVTSRTQIRKKLAAYNAGSISEEELNTFTAPKLADAMNLSEDMDGIRRLDRSGRLVVSVGVPIPKEWWPVPGADSRDVLIKGPFLHQGRSYIVLGAHIYGRDTSRVGSDIVLFNTGGLRNLVQDSLGLGVTGETLIGSHVNNSGRIFFPSRKAGAGPDGSLPADSTVSLALEKAMRREQGILSPGNAGAASAIVAHAPIRGTSWGIVLKMDQAELYRAINRQVLVTGAIVLAMILISVSGMIFLLRPLTGKILVHTEELERQNVELRKIDKMKDGLLRDVSHELKTPVAKHAMQLEILRPVLEGRDLGTEQRNALAVMEKSVRRQEKVIRNLLDLARLEGGKRAYRKDRVRLEDVLSKVKEDFRTELETFGAEFTTDLPPVTLETDAEMLWHVISNVVTNSIKFRRSDVPLKIAASAAIRNGTVLLELRDNGRGMNEEEVRQVFSEFFQASSSTEGSGVGLAICKRITTELGGRIRIHSDGPDRGVCVFIELPLKGGAAPGVE